MKAATFFAISSLCILCVKSKLESKFAGVPSVHSLVIAAGSRHKRQEPQEDCTRREEFNQNLVNAWCNPNDPNGHYVDVLQECNMTGDAISWVYYCSRDENQRFCSGTTQDPYNDLSSAMENCPNRREYFGYQCTNSCRDAL